MYFLTIKLHFPLVCEIQHSLSLTPLKCMILFFPLSNLLIHTYFFFFFSHDPSVWTFLSSTTSASSPRPSSFLPVPCQQGYARCDCQASSEPSGGPAGIKDGMMWPIFSMPRCSEDTAWPCQNQSHVGPSFDMSFAVALSFKVVFQKCLW